MWTTVLGEPQRVSNSLAPRRRRAPLILALVAVVLSLTMGGCGHLVERSQPRPKYYDLADRCRAQLRPVVMALRAYLAEHKGEWPSTLEEMYPGYLSALPHCPGDTFPKRQSYWYRRPPAGANGSTIVITCERHRTPVGAPTQDGLVQYVTKDLKEVHIASTLRKF